MHEVSSEACKVAQIQCDTSNFISDITKVSNLIIEESNRYHFIHKSIQEFYAANFVKNRSDLMAEKFYSGVLDGGFRSWGQELAFLSQIDSFRYNKYLMIPSYSRFFGALGIDGVNWIEIPRDKIEEFLSGFFIGGLVNDTRTHKGCYFRIPMTDIYAVTFSMIDLFQKLLSCIRTQIYEDEKMIYLMEEYKDHVKSDDLNGELSLFPVFKGRGLLAEAEKIIRDHVKEHFDSYLKIHEYVAREESNIQLMQIDLG